MTTTRQRGSGRWLAVMLIGFAAVPCDGAPSVQEQVPMKTIYDCTLPDIAGRPVNLGAFQGRVLLLVNVASRCGFTPQYAGLQQLYTRYQSRGLVVLGFPANNFLGQEPGTDAEIKTFCTTKYNVTFPLLAKLSVKGADQHPLYRFLTSKETNPDFAGAITWNFNKFLVGRDGKILARFGSRTAPDDKELVAAVEKALQAEASPKDQAAVRSGG